MPLGTPPPTHPCSLGAPPPPPVHTTLTRILTHYAPPHTPHALRTHTDTSSGPPHTYVCTQHALRQPCTHPGPAAAPTHYLEGSRRSCEVRDLFSLYDSEAELWERERLVQDRAAGLGQRQPHSACSTLRPWHPPPFLLCTLALVPLNVQTHTHVCTRTHTQRTRAPCLLCAPRGTFQGVQTFTGALLTHRCTGVLSTHRQIYTRVHMLRSRNGHTPHTLTRCTSRETTPGSSISVSKEEEVSAISSAGFNSC